MKQLKIFLLIVLLSVMTALFMDCKTKPGNGGDGDNSQLSGWLYTAGNKIFKSNGEIWMGRGANLQDTRGCNACTWSSPDAAEVKRRIDELVDVWGANFIRLTLESYQQAWGRTHWQGLLQDSQYLDDIKEIVDWIGSKTGVYVLLSMWSEPTFSGMGWPTDNTIPIWEKLAETFSVLLSWSLMISPVNPFESKSVSFILTPQSDDSIVSIIECTNRSLST